MNEIGQLTMEHIKPWWGRVTVIESMVDEEERESGLVVPFKYEGSDEFKRGIVMAVDQFYDEENPAYRVGEVLVAGTVVYYQGGKKIGDITLVAISDILAYEVSG